MLLAFMVMVCASRVYGYGLCFSRLWLLFAVHEKDML